MTVVSMNYLLEAGVHFGHQKRRWNPKMKEYIYTSRDDIYIIDLQKTVKLIEEAYEEIKKLAENEGTFLFIGTKKQANEAMQECAERTGMYYVINRWLGGTLTNFKTIRQRIRRIEEIEKMEEQGTFELLPKKEVIKIRAEYEKLNNNLCGIREMKKLPSAIIIVDPRQEETAIKEARKLKIPVFGIVDTNCDPDMVDFVIPANDDAVRAVKLVIGVLANAIAEINGSEVVNYVSNEDKNKTKELFEENLKEASKKNKQEDKKVEELIEETFEEKEELKPVKKIVKKESEKTEEVVEEIIEDIKKVTKKITNKEDGNALKIEKEVKPKKESKKVDLDSLTLADLKALAKDKGIKGYSTLKKVDLISALQ